MTAQAPRAFAQAPPRRRSAILPSDTLLLVDVVLILAVSGGMLWSLGINYDGLTGSAVQKIHPSTYLTVLLFAWTVLRSGDPVGRLVALARRHPGSLLMAFAGFAFFVEIAARAAPGVAGALDTFLVPGLVAMLLFERSYESLRRVETVVHAVMLANAALGLVEFASGQRFFPYRLDGAIFETDTRSAALQGHPLGNATLTACYVLMLVAGGGSLRPASRLAMVALQCAALVTFGGRSGIVVTLVLGGGHGLVRLAGLVARGRVPLLGAAVALLVLPLVPVGIGVLAYLGFFTALLDRFAADGGSANARVAMFDLFGQLPLRGLVVAPDTDLVETLRRIDGLEWGIENPVIRTLLYHGAVVTAALTVAVTLFLVELARRCRRGIALPMIAFLVLINTFESIGGKTTLLTKFVVLLIALYRRPDRPAPSGGPPSPRAPATAGSTWPSGPSRPNPSVRFHMAQGNPKPSAPRRTSPM